MNIQKIILAAAVCAASFSALAGTMGPVEAPKSWSIIGGLGYTWYQDAYSGGPGADPVAQNAIGDGQTPIGRFAIGKEWYQWDCMYLNTVHLGSELGVQSGNIMRLGASQETYDLLGGLPVQMNVKPMLDLLATFTFDPMANKPVFNIPAFGVVKAGIAYRRMQINDRVTVNDISQIAFETQAGIGMSISDRATLAVVYQGIFGSSTDYTVNTTNFTGHINNIPLQNGLLLNLSYTV